MWGEIGKLSLHSISSVSRVKNAQYRFITLAETFTWGEMDVIQAASARFGSLMVSEEVSLKMIADTAITAAQQIFSCDWTNGGITRSGMCLVKYQIIPLSSFKSCTLCVTWIVYLWIGNYYGEDQKRILIDSYRCVCVCSKFKIKI